MVQAKATILNVQFSNGPDHSKTKQMVVILSKNTLKRNHSKTKQTSTIPNTQLVQNSSPYCNLFFVNQSKFR